jgi:predicted ATPase
VQRRSNYFILAGTSGTGKTSVLNALRADGEQCVAESAREILSEQLAVDGPGLPSKNPSLFISMMMNHCVQAFESSASFDDVVYFDRGMPDLVHYAVRFNVAADGFQTAGERYRYNGHVFLFPPWREIFVNDSELEMSFEKSIEFHEMLTRTYEQFGYQLIEVPLGTVQERSTFIQRKSREFLTHLSHPK